MLGRDVSDRDCLSSAVLVVVVVVVVVEYATVIAPSFVGQRVWAPAGLTVAEHALRLFEAAVEAAHEREIEWLHCRSLIARRAVSTARLKACAGVFFKHPESF